MQFSLTRPADFQSGIGYESWWRRSLQPYRPVARRWEDGHQFEGCPFELKSVARLDVYYRKGSTLQYLLDKTLRGEKIIAEYDSALLELGEQYDIVVNDEVNLNVFRLTARANTQEVIRFFDSIRFTHGGPIELLSFATQRSQEVEGDEVVGLDYADRNEGVNHLVTAIVREKGKIAARIRNTLSGASFIPPDAGKGGKRPESAYYTMWEAGTCFVGLDKNYVDPMPYEATH